MEDLWILMFFRLSMCLIAFTISVGLMIPLGIGAFNQWKLNQQLTDLSKSIALSVFAFLFLMFVEVILVQHTLLFEINYMQNHRIIEILIVIFLAGLLSYITIPKSLQLFKKWKTTKESKYFSRMVFFGILSVYEISILFAIMKSFARGDCLSG